MDHKRKSRSQLLKSLAAEAEERKRKKNIQFSINFSFFLSFSPNRLPFNKKNAPRNDEENITKHRSIINNLRKKSKVSNTTFFARLIHTRKKQSEKFQSAPWRKIKNFNDSEERNLF